MCLGAIGSVPGIWGREKELEQEKMRGKVTDLYGLHSAPPIWILGTQKVTRLPSRVKGVRWASLMASLKALPCAAAWAWSCFLQGTDLIPLGLKEPHLQTVSPCVISAQCTGCFWVNWLAYWSFQELASKQKLREEGNESESLKAGRSAKGRRDSCFLGAGDRK